MKRCISILVSQNWTWFTRLGCPFEKVGLYTRLVNTLWPCLSSCIYTLEYISSAHHKFLHRVQKSCRPGYDQWHGNVTATFQQFSELSVASQLAPAYKRKVIHYQLDLGSNFTDVLTENSSCHHDEDWSIQLSYLRIWITCGHNNNQLVVTAPR